MKVMTGLLKHESQRRNTSTRTVFAQLPMAQRHNRESEVCTAILSQPSCPRLRWTRVHANVIVLVRRKVCRETEKFAVNATKQEQRFTFSSQLLSPGYTFDRGGVGSQQESSRTHVCWWLARTAAPGIGLQSRGAAVSVAAARFTEPFAAAAASSAQPALAALYPASHASRRCRRRLRKSVRLVPWVLSHQPAGLLHTLPARFASARMSPAHVARAVQLHHLRFGQPSLRPWWADVLRRV